MRAHYADTHQQRGVLNGLHFGITLLLWAAALYLLLTAARILRARHALRYNRRSSRLFRETDVECCMREALPRRVRDYFAGVGQELQSAGFRPLCIYSSLSARKSLGGENFNEILLSADGSIAAGISYFLTPRWFYAPYLKRPWPRLTGRLVMSLVLESELADGTVLTTHQLPRDPAVPAQFVVQRLLPEVAPARAAARHAEALAALGGERKCETRRFSTVEEYFDFYRRTKRALADFHRKNFEQRVAADLAGLPFRDLIDP